MTVQTAWRTSPGPEISRFRLHSSHPRELLPKRLPEIPLPVPQHLRAISAQAFLHHLLDHFPHRLTQRVSAQRLLEPFAHRARRPRPKEDPAAFQLEEAQTTRARSTPKQCHGHVRCAFRRGPPQGQTELEVAHIERLQRPVRPLVPPEELPGAEQAAEVERGREHVVAPMRAAECAAEIHSLDGVSGAEALQRGAELLVGVPDGEGGREECLEAEGGFGEDGGDVVFVREARCCCEVGEVVWAGVLQVAVEGARVGMVCNFMGGRLLTHSNP